MLKVGITGGIGSGKTTVCQLFESLSIPVFYADQVANSLTETNPLVKEAIKANFGNQLYKAGSLDRKQLANIVFNDKTKLELLNSIVHPEVGKAYDKWILLNINAKYTLKEAAILFETGGHLLLDKTIVVSAPEAIRIKRVVQRDGASIAEVQARIQAQMDDDERLVLADFVINNNGDLPLMPQVLEIHNQLNLC